MPLPNLAETLWREARFAVRALATTPMATAVAVLSLAVTIGANTTIFSILNGLILRPLPVRDPEQLVHVTDSVLRETGETRIRVWSNPFWEQLRLRQDLFAGVAAWSFTRFDVGSGGETQFIDGMWVDGGFLETLGIPAALGRTLSARDDQRGGGPDGAVAVISHAYWQRRFGGAPDVIGRIVRLNSVPFTIVGVTPPGFFGLEVGRTFDVMAPLGAETLVRGRDSALDSASTNFLSIVACLKSGQSLDAAAARLRGVQREIREAIVGPWSKDVIDRYLTSPFTVIAAARGDSNLRAAFQRPLIVVAGVVLLLLLIGCVNIANLLLARTCARRHDLQVRLALGASRGRVVRELLVESLALSAAGATLGILLAVWGSTFLVRQLSTPVNVVFLDTSIDGSVLAFTSAVTVLTTLLFGAAPALRAARLSAGDALKEQGRSTTAADGRVAGSLVVIQVSLSLVLLATAGVFIRSLAWLTSRPLGFDGKAVLVATIDPERARVPASERVALYERLRTAVLELPNVADAAISSRTPLAGGGFTPPVEILGGGGIPQLVPADQDVFGNLISPGLFSTLGTPVVAGRDITDNDGRGAPRVAVVNETFSRRFHGTGSVIGATIVVWPQTPRALSAQIVGVVADSVYGSPRDAVPPMWFLPMTQFDAQGYPFVPARISIRAAGAPPALLTRSVAIAARTVNPQLALTFRPLADQVRGSITRERLVAQLGASFGAIALLLAGLGLYGVMSQMVSRRQTEIGIRMALGAEPSHVIARVLARVAMLVGIGVAAGMSLSLWASRFVEGLVFGVPPGDFAAVAAASLTLLAAGALAAWAPVRRAIRIDPATVLREG
jgi:putative ABC transport system permease protein